MRLKKAFLNSYKKMTFVEITHGQKDTESFARSLYSRTIIDIFTFHHHRCPVLSCFIRLLFSTEFSNS